MKKNKILYVVSVLNQSGPTNQLLNIVSNLDLNQFDFKIVTLSPESSKTMIEKFKQFNLESLNLSRIKGILFSKKMLEKIIKNYSPDIIHTSGIRADSLLFSLKKYKFIHTIRNFPEVDYKMKFGKYLGFIMAKKHLNIIKKSQTGIACSKSLKDAFSKKNINLDFVQNGVDTQKFFPISSEKKIALRKKYKIDEDKKVFITVGSLIERKNVALIIDCWNSKIRKSQLLIAGDGDQKISLLAQSNQNPNIIFLGNISTVQEFLQLSDFFISASISEGLPNSVLEAMATGLPCLLSDIDSHREIVGLLPKKEQLIFDLDVGLYKMIRSLKTFDYEELSASTVRIIKQNFSAKTMSEKYQNIYRKINEK